MSTRKSTTLFMTDLKMREMKKLGVAIGHLEFVVWQSPFRKCYFLFTFQRKPISGPRVWEFNDRDLGLWVRLYGWRFDREAPSNCLWGYRILIVVFLFNSCILTVTCTFIRHQVKQNKMYILFCFFFLRKSFVSFL